ncbi:tRNA dihydrouridine(20/20a) synthase DusA [Candidatus Pantoea edessiphila]|uniref:tRNA-dihydrouridine(20/20a) synthase n=1 Tax=Candidatus Pantoea edessiphila TaxID=2044610 RepID=A0A2P5SZZ4_9GAMM|nr:tRNA dihydrouridine(20/20a) synthase DusA [Candidatus Pantoea edessiphila]PPI87901.1 tRNA dihydrouridine(20/20a) synthase DusA [Candidatus Pantoea edessiphila]
MNDYHHRFSVAPMLGWTDRHCRYFYRQLSKYTLLYTEMINTKKIINNENSCLDFNEDKHLVALQLSGSNSSELAYCARLAQHHGYKEINLNIGCPSYRAQKGYFGACLMTNANLVGDNIKAIYDVVDIPVTIKTRIGVDEKDSYTFLSDFIGNVSKISGCRNFIFHARKAILSKYNPKKNRKIPILKYSYVYNIKRDFPSFTIIINGGIETLEEAQIHLQYLDGVMIGRAIYSNPRILSEVDSKIFGCKKQVHPILLVRNMYPYINNELKNDIKINKILRHMLYLFKGIPGSSKWRRYLSNNIHKSDTGIWMIEEALKTIKFD